MKKVVTALAFIFAIGFAPAAAQDVPDGPTEKDSVTVSVEALRNLKHEFNVVERKVELQQVVIEEQDRQIKLYKRRVHQDSTLEALNKKQLEVRQERIELRDERIKELEQQNTWLKIGTGAAAVVGFLLGAA
jgi:hypothetical protein